MKLERTTNGVTIQNGWDKFVKDHCLELGDFLVFRYNGDLNFTVQIFDRTACEKDLFDVGYGEELSFHQVNKKQKEINEEPVQDFHVPQSNSCKVKAQKKNVRGQPSSSKNEYSTKKRQVGKKHSGYFASSRRPVTEEERARAYEASTSFKSSKPRFTLVMKPSQVYAGFYVHIPKLIARKYCLRRSKAIFLTDPSRRKWRLYCHCKGSDNFSFRTGWKLFSLMNNLEEGDACVFELVDDCNFDVHIFRVVNEIKPLVYHTAQHS